MKGAKSCRKSGLDTINRYVQNTRIKIEALNITYFIFVMKIKRELLELKHLSRGRKRNQM